MYHYYCEMNESILADIQPYEDQQLAKFQREFGPLCLSASNSHGWNYTVSIHRWIDTTDKLRSSPFDGYTATLHVDFADSNGNFIEIDEAICSFFENITCISFIPLLREYRVFQNEVLGDIRKEIKFFAQSLDKFQ